MILTVPNEILLPQVIEMLADGSEVVLPVKGWSMNPFIDGDRDSVLLVRAEEYHTGDVVLALVRETGCYVLHRIIDMKADGSVTLMGDGNICGVEHCHVSNIGGRAVSVIKPSGKNRSLTDRRAMRRAGIWKRLLPVRRWLLAFYRHIILKLK